MSKKATQYVVEVTITQTFKVTVGGDRGSVRIDDESDDDAARAIVLDHYHLQDAFLPAYVTRERSDVQAETITRVLERA